MSLFQGVQILLNFQDLNIHFDVKYNHKHHSFYKVNIFLYYFLKIYWQILHYRILNDSKKLINSIKEKFGKNKNFIFEESVIPSESFHNSKCLISDWSGISFEYAFVFEKPIIFIDVPKKILNTEFNRISSEPIEIAIREKIGKIVSPDNLSEIPDLIKKIDIDSNLINDEIKEIRSKTVFNINKSASVGAEYIKKILDN